MKMRSIAPIRAAKIGYIVMSCVFCAVGILFMTHTELSAELLARVFGAALILFGGIKIIGYFSKDLFRLAFQYDLEFGVILLMLGLIVLIKPKEFTEYIFTAMGIIMLADSLFKIRIAFESKRFGIASWFLTLSMAIISGVFGIGLMLRPWEAAGFMTIFFGASLLAEGIMNLCVSISLVKIVRNQYPDMI